MQEPPHNGADDDDGDDDDPEAVAAAARQAYIDRISSAYRAPIGNEADAVQAAFIQTAGGEPGASRGGGEADAIAAYRRGRKPGTAGVTFGAHNPSAFPTTDAAADRDAAYQGYLDRLTNAWHR
jgi:hypothetical protein